MKKWKVAIVGCGDIAENVYMPQMPRNARAEVVACCDLKEERTRLFTEKFGIGRAFSDIDALLDWGDFDILMDTASIPAHFDINMKALSAKKHLYSQKPIGLTVDEADAMIRAAGDANVKFSASPIHMLRPDIQAAKRMIEDGAIGRVLLVRAMTAHGGPEYFQYRVNDPSWFYEPGAGALYDLGVHVLTMVTGLVGPAKRISCMAATSEPERTIRSGNYDGKRIQSDKLFDNYLINLDFGGGALAAIETGFCVKGARSPSIEIFGELGSITFTDDPVNPLEVYIDCPDRGVRGFMNPLAQVRPAPEFYQCSAIADLIEAIEHGREVGLSPKHARHVVDIMVEVEAAARDGLLHTLKTTF